MQTAQAYLEIVKSRGERRLELQRVYRNLQNQELFLMAYAKLYANEGATTAGTDPNDTVDGMSLKRIEKIIQSLEAGTYQWKPTKRVYIPKANGKLRPLGIPSWEDKLLQEVIRMVLSAYYEPQFSDASHGFRPERGCHTALQDILFKWKGTKWFIEGDIKGCFDNIDHDKLLEIIGRNIKDDRLLKLLRGMLKAGYMEEWRYNQTYSGTPQGGVISPLFANIFLNELDQFVEQELIPQYNKGEKREPNPEYVRLQSRIATAKARGDIETYRQLVKERRKLPSVDPFDPQYRRLKYVRYADDFLLGFVGQKAEAEAIKQQIKDYLTTMRLNLSDEKTLITHATEDRATFLGYEIQMGKADDQIANGRRTVNGKTLLKVPKDVVQKWENRYLQHGKPIHRAELMNNSDYDIVMTYQMEVQGLINYYVMAYNVSILHKVRSAYLQSLVKTLAVKHKKSVPQIFKHHRIKENGLNVIIVVEEREGKKPLVAKFGAKPIRYNKKAVIRDTVARLHNKRNELIRRLLAEECELCGGQVDVEVHHIRKLKDLVKRYQGRKNPPTWVIRMMEIKRKSLVVCTYCHNAIHSGTYDGKALK
jgi:group II intron reverse transcriptase/maturase